MPAKKPAARLDISGRVGSGSAPAVRLDITGDAKELGVHGIGTKPKPKTKPKKPGGKKAAIPKNKARQHPHPPVIWACTVDGWVRYRGTRYEKGDTILVQPGKMSETDLTTLQKYFEPSPTEVMVGVSEPIQLLDEGEKDVSNSS